MEGFDEVLGDGSGHGLEVPEFDAEFAVIDLGGDPGVRGIGIGAVGEGAEDEVVGEGLLGADEIGVIGANEGCDGVASGFIFAGTGNDLESEDGGGCDGIESEGLFSFVGIGEDIAGIAVEGFFIDGLMFGGGSGEVPIVIDAAGGIGSGGDDPDISEEVIGGIGVTTDDINVVIIAGLVCDKQGIVGIASQVIGAEGRGAGEAIDAIDSQFVGSGADGGFEFDIVPGAAGKGVCCCADISVGGIEDRDGAVGIKHESPDDGADIIAQSEDVAVVGGQLGGHIGETEDHGVVE